MEKYRQYPTAARYVMQDQDQVVLSTMKMMIICFEADVDDDADEYDVD